MPQDGAQRDRWQRELVGSIVDRTCPVLLDRDEAMAALRGALRRAAVLRADSASASAALRRTAPSVCQGDGVELPPKEGSMEQAATIGLDIAKHVFQVHGADGAGHVLFRKRITRVKLLSFLAAVLMRQPIASQPTREGPLPTTGIIDAPSPPAVLKSRL
jgi:hypothetical protein